MNIANFFDFPALVPTITTSILGAISVLIITNLLKKIGRIKVILLDAKKIYYNKEDKEVETPPEAFDYTYFYCTFQVELYNGSSQIKVIHDLGYGLCDWGKITKERIRTRPIVIQPKQCYSLEFTVRYEREYQNYFKDKKHYICFRNPGGWNINKRLFQVKERTALKQKEAPKKFRIVQCVEETVHNEAE